MRKYLIILGILGLISFVPYDNVDIINVQFYSGNPAGNWVLGGIPANGTTPGVGTNYSLRRFYLADLTNRAYHTGAQAISTVSGLQAALNGLQPLLTSGSNIKTVNGTSILGSGNITISASGFDTAQTATQNQLNKYYTDHAPKTDVAFSSRFFQVISGTIFPYGGSTSITASPGGTIVGGSTNPNGHSNGGWVGLTTTGSTSLTDGVDILIVTFGETYPATPAIIKDVIGSFPGPIRLKNVSTTGFTICAAGTYTLPASTSLFSFHVTPS